MPRYRFSERDLARLLPLMKLPGAELLLQATPIKQPGLRSQHLEDIGAPPVTIRGRATPDGVPLHDLLALVRQQDRHVDGLVVRGGRLFAIRSAPPRDEQKAAVRRLLTNKPQLTALLAKRAGDQKPPLLSEHEMEQALRDGATPDAKWLRAFRQYAMRQMIPTHHGHGDLAYQADTSGDPSVPPEKAE